MAQPDYFKLQSVPSEFNDGSKSDVERYMRTLIKNSPLVVFALTPDGTVKYADGAVLKSLGMAANDAVGRNVFDLYKNSFWTQAAIRSVIRDKKTTLASGKLSNGVTDFWYDACYVPKLDEKDNLLEIVGYALDITSEKRARDLALQLAEEKLAAMNASMDGMVMFGQEGTIQYANDAFLELFGYPHRTSLIGKNWRLFFENSDVDRLLTVKEALTREKHWRGESKGKKASGHLFFCEVSISQIQVPHLATGVICVVRDITERKKRIANQDFAIQAATALSESLDYEITLKKIAHCAIKKFASWCVVTLVNEQGTTERVVVGAEENEKEISALLSEVPMRCSENHINRRVHVTHQVDHMHHVDNSFLKNIFPVEADRRRYEPLGISAYICVPLIAAKTFLGAITFIKSKLKIIPEEDPHYDERDVATAMEVSGRMALGVHNAKLYRETKEAVRSREELIASVSHDLKNPLSVISLNAELIVRIASTSTKQDLLKKLAATIRTSAKRMNSLIRELLELEKLRGGKFYIQKNDLSVHDLIDTAVGDIETLLTQKSVTLQKVEPANDLVIKGDRERLLRVFSNLLGNALKFTPVNGRIQISSEYGNQTVKFSVTDNGPGIRKEDLPRVFDRYWRSETSDKMGAGIGLTIARSIILAHGGSISAESTFGQGATFSFTIPRE